MPLLLREPAVISERTVIKILLLRHRRKERHGPQRRISMRKSLTIFFAVAFGALTAGAQKPFPRGTMVVLPVDDPNLSGEACWSDPNIIGVALRTMWRGRPNTSLNIATVNNGMFQTKGPIGSSVMKGETLAQVDFRLITDLLIADYFPLRERKRFGCLLYARNNNARPKITRPTKNDITVKPITRRRLMPAIARTGSAQNG
jgi:hypothetical protein